MADGPRWMGEEDPEWVNRWMTPPPEAQSPQIPQQQAPTAAQWGPGPGGFECPQESQWESLETSLPETSLPPTWGPDTESTPQWDVPQTDWLQPPQTATLEDEEESVLRQYPAFEKEKSQKPAKTKRRLKVAAPRFNLRGLVTAMVALGLLAVVVIFGFKQGGERTPEETASVNPQATNHFVIEATPKGSWLERDKSYLAGIRAPLEGFSLKAEMDSSTTTIYTLAATAEQYPAEYVIATADMSGFGFAEASDVEWVNSSQDSRALKLANDTQTRYLLMARNTDGSISALLVDTALKGDDLLELESSLTASTYIP